MHPKPILEDILLMTREMRMAGYAVVVWTPEEIKQTGVTKDEIENASITYINDYYINQI